MPKTLQQYLQDAMDQGAIDHTVRVTGMQDGRAHLYIHPANQDGETLDFMLDGNTLVPVIPDPAEPVSQEE